MFQVLCSKIASKKSSGTSNSRDESTYDTAKLQAQIEIWKQTIAVQQHFNDIEMRIRGLALTVLTFALGGATVAVKGKHIVTIDGAHIKLGTIALGAGFIIWMMFYFMDRIWYHKLLIGAVRHGQTIEDQIESQLPEIALTKSISKSSPYPVKLYWWWKKSWTVTELHSDGKIRAFYYSVAVVLAALALFTQLGVGT